MRAGFALLSFLFPSPTLTPVQKAPEGAQFFPFLHGLIGSFAHSFIHPFVCSFIHSSVHPNPPRSARLLARTRRSPAVAPDPPPGLSPAPFPPRPLSRPIGAGWPGGAGAGAGPCSPTTPGGARGSGNAPRGCWGSGGRWRLRGVSCHAGPAWAAPAPLHRRSAEGSASAAAGPG